MAVLLYEVSKGQIHVELMRVRILWGAFQLLNGLTADLVILLPDTKIRKEFYNISHNFTTSVVLPGNAFNLR